MTQEEYMSGVFKKYQYIERQGLGSTIVNYNVDRNLGEQLGIKNDCASKKKKK